MTQPSLYLEELSSLDPIAIEPLRTESLAFGFRFVEMLVNEYESGANRFDGPGEVLYGAFEYSRLIAVGGLNLDPYVQDQQVGRVRHLYVLSERRRHGIGRMLVGRIIEQACSHFRLLTLRTFDDDADRFYRALGFVTEPPMASVSHHMWLGDDKPM